MSDLNKRRSSFFKHISDDQKVTEYERIVRVSEDLEFKVNELEKKLQSQKRKLWKIEVLSNNSVFNRVKADDIRKILNEE